jgi:hypothetical protein
MKTIIFFFTLITGLLFGQPSTIIWQKTIGGNSLDQYIGMVKASDGGIIIGGSSNSTISGEKSENPRGSFDYWVVKLNTNQEIEWQRTIGGSGGDIARTICGTADGGCLIGGYSNSNISGEKTENSKGNFDCWLIKLDESGTIVWQKTIGGSSLDDLVSIKQTADGGYIAGCTSSSNISGDKTENNRTYDTIGPDYWILKLDALGNIEWQKTIGGGGGDFLNSIIQTSDSGYLVTGVSDSNASFEKSENSRGSNDYWVLKLNQEGTIEWQKTLGGSDVETYFPKVIEIDNGYVLSGSSYSNISGDKTENSNGGVDIWILKLSLNGDIDWQQSIGGEGDDATINIYPTSDNCYLVCGSSNSGISGDKTEESKGSSDYWILKINSIGEIIWQTSIGGSQGDSCHSILINPDGSLIAGGHSNSDSSGDKDDNCRGDLDFWVVEIEPNYLKNQSFATNKITLFPNPTSRDLTINLNNFQKEISVKITTILGETIKTKKYFNASTIDFEIENSSGIYFITLEFDHKVKTYKVIKI